MAAQVQEQRRLTRALKTQLAQLGRPQHETASPEQVHFLLLRIMAFKLVLTARSKKGGAELQQLAESPELARVLEGELEQLTPRESMKAFQRAADASTFNRESLAGAVDWVRSLSDAETFDLMPAVHELLVAQESRLDQREARRCAGIYYTPPELARRLADATLRPLLDGRTLSEVALLRVIDPACGAGAMLLAAFRTLESWYDEVSHETNLALKTWRKTVVTTMLAGTDCDARAVDVTQLVLCSAAALPFSSLDGIRVSDSLLLCDRTFDAVITNPPFVRWQRLFTYAPNLARALKAPGSQARGNADAYVAFVELGLRLCGPEGRAGLLVPNKFFTARYAAPLRERLKNEHAIAGIVDFGDQQLFDGATTYVCLLLLSRRRVRTFPYEQVTSLVPFRSEQRRLSTDTLSSTWRPPAHEQSVLEASKRTTTARLSDVAELFVGVQTDADDVFIADIVGQQKETYTVRSRAENAPFDLERGIVQPLLKGSVDTRRYTPPKHQKVLIFPYDLSQANVPLLEQRRLEHSYPLCWQYLRRHRERLASRNKGRMRDHDWHGFVYRKNHARMLGPKLLIPSLGRRAQVTLDESGEFFFVGSGGGGGGGYAIRPKSDEALYYLLGVLNSAIIETAVRELGTDQYRGGYRAYNKQRIEGVPIVPLSTETSTLTVQRRIGELARECFSAGADTSARERCDREIDRLVGALYRLPPRLATACRTELETNTC